MNDIIEILKRENTSYEDLINCFELVKEQGHVAVIKFDGERDDKGYTVFILTKERMLRADENDLNKALVKVLKEYAGL